MQNRENKNENQFEKVDKERKEKKIKRGIKRVIILPLLLILAVGICIYINKDIIFKEEKGKVDIYKNIEFIEELNVEAGKEININEYIKRVIGGELIIDEEAIKGINTKKVGEIAIKLSVKDVNGYIQDFECKLNITDTVKPEIKGTESKIEMIAGNKVDLLDGVTAKDAIDGDIEVKVDGQYDVDKAGEYKLKYVAEDKSGNKVEKEFTLVVNKKEETKTNTTTTNKNTSTNKNNASSNKNNTTTSKNNTSTSKNNKTTNKKSNSLSSSSSSSSSSSLSSSGSYQSAKGLLSLVNSTRKSAGVENVSWSSSLESAAKTRAKELAQSYSHTRPNGSAFYTVNSNVYAENIANGYGSANSVHNAWVSSSGHYKNMTNSSYKTMGAAYYVVNGQTYWVELFGY